MPVDHVCKVAALSGHVRTSRAKPGQFDHGTVRVKSLFFRRPLKRPGHRAILDLRNRSAFLTDQELCCMVVMISVHTRNVCIQSFEFVNQALLHKKVQRTIDCRRHRAFSDLPQPVKQLIGRQWALGFKDEAQHQAAKLRQLGVAAQADCPGLF